MLGLLHQPTSLPSYRLCWGAQPTHVVPSGCQTAGHTHTTALQTRELLANHGEGLCLLEHDIPGLWQHHLQSPEHAERKSLALHHSTPNIRYHKTRNSNESLFCDKKTLPCFTVQLLKCALSLTWKWWMQNLHTEICDPLWQKEPFCRTSVTCVMIPPWFIQLLLTQQTKFI
jgi:hypothetical protein